MRPARQSAFACSMRSRDEETKFHSMKRGPTGSPPSAITTAGLQSGEARGATWREDDHLSALETLTVDLDCARGHIHRAFGVARRHGRTRAVLQLIVQIEQRRLRVHRGFESDRKSVV